MPIERRRAAAALAAARLRVAHTRLGQQNIAMSRLSAQAPLRDEVSFRRTHDRLRQTRSDDAGARTDLQWLVSQSNFCKARG